MAVTPVGQNRPQQPAQLEANPAAAQKSGAGGAVAYAEARASTGNDVQAQFAKDTFDPNAGFQTQQANALGGTDAAGGVDAAQDPDEQFNQALNSLVDALSSVVELVKNLLPPEDTGGQNSVGGVGQGKDPANADPNAAITRDLLDNRGGGPAEGDPLEAAGGGPTRMGLGQQPGLQGTQHGADGVAGIDQNDPNKTGGTPGYVGGSTNCGPTSMAEIARGKSLQDPNYSITFKGDDGNMQTQRVADMSNTDLIKAFAKVGDTDQKDGTSPNGMIDMATAAGEPVTDEEVHYDKSWKKGQPSNSFDQEWLDKRLQDGEKVIVNGAYQVKDNEGHDNLVGHYGTISGKNANGNYNFVDPWDGKVKELTPDEVRRFMEHNPYNGGVMIAVGKTAAEQNAQGNQG